MTKRAASFARITAFVFVLSLIGSDSWCGPIYMAIYHINVGQGDSTLVVSPTGTTLLIDGGRESMGTARVMPLLKTLGIHHIDYVVSTHYDEDHIGGIPEVLDGLGGTPARIVLDRGEADNSPATEIYATYRDAVKRDAGNYEPISLGTGTIDLGSSVTVECVAVNGHTPNGEISVEKLDENAASVALTIRFGRFSYFIGGDLSGSPKGRNMENLVAPAVGDIDVLHLSHHGGATSTNVSFLDTLKPEVVIVSVGNGYPNSGYHHPSRIILDRLGNDSNVKAVFQTNRGETKGGLTEADLSKDHVENRNIVLFSDGQSYTIDGFSFPAGGK